MNNDTYKEKARQYAESKGFNIVGPDRGTTFRLMSEYAQQEAMAFAEWCSRNCWVYIEEKEYWIQHEVLEKYGEPVAPSALWELFNNSKK